MAVEDNLKDELNRINEENSVLKTLVSEFKEQLCNSLEANENKNENNNNTSPNSHQKQSTPWSASSFSNKRTNGGSLTVSSISHPAILWKELELERKRSIMYRKQSESLQKQIDKLREGDIMEKMERTHTMLLEKVQSLTEENRALTNIQRFQEKRLLSEELLEQEWPVKIAVLQQDLNAAEDSEYRSRQLANQLRKKGIELGEKISNLKNKNKTLVEDAKSSFKEKQLLSETVSRKLYAKLESENVRLEDDKTKLRNSIRAKKKAADRDIDLLKNELKKKDEEITDLKRRLDDNQKDARQTILNMKELKKSLAGIAVGNCKVKEVKQMLPVDVKLDVMDLRALESILPEEIDTERTNFLSPQPPPSELKKTFKFNATREKMKLTY